MGLGNKKFKQLAHERFSDVLDAATAQKNSTSKLLYVDSSTGNASYNALRVVSPVNKLDSCINLASAHDSIRVLPSHTEALTLANEVLIDVAGLDIQGLGQGTNKPLFNFGATGATIKISANNVSFKNFVMSPTVDSVVSPIVVTGGDSDIDVTIKDASDTVEFVKGITYNGCLKGKLKMDYIGRTGGNACTHAILMTDCSDFDIDLHFYGKASTSVVEFLTTSCKDIRITAWYHNDGISNFSKTVIDTAGSSTWSFTGWDNVAGMNCSGGNAAAIAGDDVSTVTAAVAALQTDLGNPSARTNLQTIEAMLGCPDTAGASIYAAIGSAAGLVSYPAAAPAADGVSVAEVVRYVQESQVGTLTNTGGTATLGGIIGDVANSSIATRLTNLASAVDAVDNFVDTEVAAIKTETDQIGTIVNTGGTATVAGVLGDFANVTAVTKFANIQTEVDKVGVVVNTGGTATLGGVLGDVSNTSVATRLTNIESKIDTVDNFIDTEVADIKTETDQIGTMVNTGGTATIAGVLGDFANVTAVTKFSNIQTEVNKIGTVVNTGGTATLGGVIGDVANVTLVSRLDTIDNFLDTEVADIKTETDQIGTVVNTGGTATLAGVLGDFANVTAVTKFSNIQTEVNKVGVIVNTGGTATVGGVLGDVANVTVATRLGNISTETDQIGTVVNTGGTATLAAAVGDVANIALVTRLQGIAGETDQIGTVVNTGGTATVGGVLGDFANVTLVSRLNTIDDFLDTEIGAADGATTESINGKLGTDTELADRSIYDQLNGAGPAAAAVAAAPGNDVSLYGAVRFISETQVTRLATKTYADLTGYDTAAAFTVTGDVVVRVFGVVGAAAITCTSGTSTLSVGTTADPAVCLPATTMDNSDFAIGDVWVDNNPENDAGAVGATAEIIIGNGADIILTRNVDDITAGTLTLYCEWRPLSAGATVVAA